MMTARLEGLIDDLGACSAGSDEVCPQDSRKLAAARFSATTPLWFGGIEAPEVLFPGAISVVVDAV